MKINNIGGLLRRETIYAFREWKGSLYVPKTVPNILKWTKADPWENIKPEEGEFWKIIAPKKTSAKPTVKQNNQENATANKQTAVTSMFIPAKSSKGLQTVSIDERTNIKRKRDSDNMNIIDNLANDSKHKDKKMRLDTYNSCTEMDWGFEWSNNSCAYDSLFSILYCLFKTSNTIWSESLLTLNPTFTLLSNMFTNIQNKVTSAEDARDNMRVILNNLDTTLYPLDNNLGTDIISLSKEILGEVRKYYFRRHRCTHCNTTQNHIHDRHEANHSWLLQFSADQWKNQVNAIGTGNRKSTTDWIQANLLEKANSVCSNCTTTLINELAFVSMPTFFQCYIDKVNIKWDYTFILGGAKYRLCGLIYYGAFHFTTRIITSDKSIWFNDSMKHGRKFNLEGNMTNISGSYLSTAPDARKCILAIYVKDAQ